MLEALAAVYAEQTIPDSYPYFDALEFGDDGALWVRIIRSDVPDIHPAA